MFKDPGVGSQILIDGKNYFFTEAPNAPGIVYAEIGRKAKVYQLTYGSESFAFKAFKPRYRTQHTIQNTPQIAQYQNVPGLSVAKRVVLTPDKYPELIQGHEAFAYAVLMPWVDGKSWFNYITGRVLLKREESLRLARALVNAVCELETRDLAHCDLSSSNFIFSADYSHVELIDIEDLFGYGLLPMDEKPRGTGGYAPGWIKTEGIWEAGADRFALGILLSEILGWQYEDIRAASDSDTYFAEDEFGNKTKRFRMLSDRLEQIHPELSRLFKVVWYAESVEECPRIAAWKKVLDTIRDPEMVVTPDFLQFGVLDLRSTPPLQPELTIEITNSGGGVLEGQAVSNVPWIKVTPDKFTCYEGKSSKHKVVLGLEAPVTKKNTEYSFKDGITIRGNQRSQTLSGRYSIAQYQPKRPMWLVPAIISFVVLCILGFAVILGLGLGIITPTPMVTSTQPIAAMATLAPSAASMVSPVPPMAATATTVPSNPTAITTQKQTMPSVITSTYLAIAADAEVILTHCTQQWQICRNLTTSDSMWTGLQVGTAGASFDKDHYTIQRLLLYFDTTAIPENSIITGAVLHIHIDQYLNGNTTIHVVQSTAQLSPSTVDFGHVGDLSGGSIKPTSRNVWMEIVLNASAFSWIVPSGTTRLALTNDLDLMKVAPTATNDVLISLFESGQYAPYLDVTYIQGTTTPSASMVAQVIVSTQGLNVRTGPGTNYSIITSFPEGTLLDVIGRSDTGNWLVVWLPDLQRNGWISTAFVTLGFDISTLPIVAAPPAPPPKVTNPPEPTAAQPKPTDCNSYGTPYPCP